MQQDNNVCNKINREFALRLRNENPEQYQTLVRMHLSFELDLNTEDNDDPQYEKGILKKLNLFHKKAKGCTTVKTVSPTDCSLKSLTMETISQLRKLISFLVEDQNIIQEGIFRRTGAVSRQTELKNILTQGLPLNLQNGEYTVHDCASVLKGLLADLPEPLLTDAYHMAHCQLADLCINLDSSMSGVRKLRLLHSLQLLLLLLPEDNRTLLEDLIEMLHKTKQYESKNKMSSDSLATLFTPHLICPRTLSPEALHSISQQMSGVVSFMITKGPVLFDIPLKLATDIRAYFAEQKRKKTMSPDHILDESVTSDSTASTVYTFVDRVKTAEAHNSNPTDEALAELYAHIQKLPESSRKRKLVKQFNKENGQGTPLQFLRLHGHIKNQMTSSSSSSSAVKSGKSLGDSIKKHIFHKSLLPKTPKRSHTPSGFDTPNGSITKPKIRALFQTPTNNTKFYDRLSSTKHQISMTTLTQNNHNSSIVNKTQSPFLSSSPSSFSSLVKSDNINTPTTMVITKIDKLIAENDSHEQTINEDCVEKSKQSKLTDFSLENSLNDVAKVIKLPQLQFKYNSEPVLNKSIMFEIDHNRNNDNDQEDKLQKVNSLENLKLNINENNGRSKVGDCSNNSAGSIGDDLENRTLSTNRNISYSVIASPTINHIYHHQPHYYYFNQKPYVLRESTSDWILDQSTNSSSVISDRTSMSPITKSTQRMPKYMQESIMTPRSRKPVMLLGLNLGSSGGQNNKKICFREEDEDFLQQQTHLQEKSKSENDLSQFSAADDECKLILSNYASNLSNNIDTQCKKLSIVMPCVDENNSRSTSAAPDSLTSTFRDYLFSRSVLTASPADLSFSSQPDDFGSATDIRDLSESEMSESLLYCLDGNKPLNTSSIISSNDDGDHSNNDDTDVDKVKICLSNTRKRSLNLNETQFNYGDVFDSNDQVQIKKMVLHSGLGETSL